MTDNDDEMTINPEKLTKLSSHPGLLFSYHLVLLPKTGPELKLGDNEYVVGLRVRKIKMEIEDLIYSNEEL
jgi:hypothetical protein